MRIKCRDPIKLPAGRVFHYHGHLFQPVFALDYIVYEVPGEEDDLLGDDIKDQGKINENNGDGNLGGKTSHRANGSRGNANSHSAGSQNISTRQDTTKVRLATGEGSHNQPNGSIDEC